MEPHEGMGKTADTRTGDRVQGSKRAEMDGRCISRGWREVGVMNRGPEGGACNTAGLRTRTG